MSRINQWMSRFKILGLNKCQLLFMTMLILYEGVFSSKTCNFSIKIEQNLKNEGFHRNLTYEIKFDTDNDRDTWIYDDCMVGLSQELPSGVFANPDELDEFRRNNKLNAIHKNRVNIELPAELSDPNVVYITGEVEDGKSNLWLPIHARYHKAVSGGGTARNYIGPPTLFLQCPYNLLDSCGLKKSSTAVLCKLKSEECNWKNVPFTMMTDNIIWDVPVGNTDHYYMVASGTAAVVIVGSLYLLMTIHEYKIKQQKKKL